MSNGYYYENHTQQLQFTDVLKGKRNSAKGYTFEYQKEVI